MLGYGKSTKNAAVLTILSKYGNINTLNTIQNLFDSLDEKKISYWVEFGYKYLALLRGYAFDEIIKYVNETKTISNKNYALNILEIYYGEHYPQNLNIIRDIQEGIQKFSDDVIDKKLDITMELAFSGIEYLADYAGKYDIKNIYEAVRKVIIDDKEYLLPITPNEKYSFGVVYPWPGTDTAETELLARMAKAAENVGFKYVMLSDFGHVLDETQHETDMYVKADELDFVMTTHYESHKTIDSYYYHLLWNPPEIPLNTSYYEEKVLDNYIMNDDYLIYDFGGMSNHLRSVLINKPRTLDGASTFVGSFPKSAAMEPNLKDPKLFYCGMNWEKASGDNDRHAGLFELLDKTGKVKFYGPDIVESWGGIRPWEGYDCYQHPIPFDGFSILKEINSCGICLAISSDAHRRAGAVTNRAYEACAAGAIIISDNNVFMEEYFGDSVLYVTYNKKNPEDTFSQIMEKYQWIVENKEEALLMAKRSQKIFIDKFCMEKGILEVTQNHFKRYTTIKGDLFAKEEKNVVLVTQVLNSQNKCDILKLLKNTLLNITNQYYRNIILGVICDYSIKEDVISFANSAPVNVSVVSMKLFDEKGSRCITDGQAIRNAQKNIKHNMFINIKENEVWFYDHITTLVRVLEDSPKAMGAYSGLLSQDNKGIRRTYMFENISYSRVYLQNHPNNLPASSQLMFRAECIEFLPDYMLGCLDGLEHAAYVSLLWIKHHYDIVFSKRMTCVWKYYTKVLKGTVIDVDRQIRFIRGLVKYDVPSNGLYEMAMSNNGSQKEFMLTMPLIQSISVRFWRKVSMRMNKRYGIGKCVYQKYLKQLKLYNDVMDGIQEG